MEKLQADRTEQIRLEYPMPCHHMQGKDVAKDTSNP
jgi:hypothetical protein